MQKRSRKVGGLLRSGLGFLLAAALVLTPFAGLNAVAQATDYGSAYEQALEYQDTASESNLDLTQDDVDDDGILYQPPEYGLPYDDIAVTYQQESVMHEVVFDFNGVQQWGFTERHLNIMHGDSIRIWDIPGLTRVGYSFEGWCPVGDGSVLLSRSQVAEWVIEGPQSFTAIWEYVGTHEIVLVFNGGFGNGYGYGPAVFNITHNTHLWQSSFWFGMFNVVRPGHVFVDWCMVGDGSSLISAGDYWFEWEWIVEGPQTFYAIWEYLGLHEVTFVFNGGYNEYLEWWYWHALIGHGYGPAVINYTHGDAIAIDTFPPLERPGYSLLGWCTVGDGSDVSWQDRLIVGPQTFYAIWEQNELIEIVFSFDGGMYLYHEGGWVEWLEGQLHSYIPQWSTIGIDRVPQVRKPGYSFVGWYHEISDIVFTSAQVAEWFVTERDFFYAVWERDGNTPCADTNLALNTRGAVMSASSSQGVRTADRANNGITSGAATNSWSAAGSGQEWLMVNFGERRNFNTVRIYQGGSRIMDYRFEHSNDGVNWTVFHSSPNRMLPATPAYYEVTVPATIQAQYIRLASGHSVSALPIVVFEFEVYYMP